MNPVNPPGRTGLKVENMVKKSMLGEKGRVSKRNPGLMWASPRVIKTSWSELDTSGPQRTSWQEEEEEGQISPETAGPLPRGS